jgi:hypothetical protein
MRDETCLLVDEICKQRRGAIKGMCVFNSFGRQLWNHQTREAFDVIVKSVARTHVESLYARENHAIVCTIICQLRDVSHKCKLTNGA